AAWPHQGSAGASVRPPARRRGGTRRSAFRRIACPYLAAIAHGATQTRRARKRGRLTMTVEVRDPIAVSLVAADGLSEDREGAESVKAGRRGRGQLVEIAIRLGSLAVVLSIWEIFGARVDPVLFTTPSKIAVAAVGMIGSG